MSLSGEQDALAAAFEVMRELGVGAFKVKVGGVVEHDLARFAFARDLVGDSALLGADATEAGTASTHVEPLAAW